MSDLPPWIDAHASDASADDDEPPRRRRRWLVLGLALLPWAVIPLLLRGGGSDAAPAPAGDVEATDAVERDAASAQAPSVRDPESGHHAAGEVDDGRAARTTGTATGTAAAPTLGQRALAAVGVAETAARAWLTDVEPAPPVDGLEPQQAGYPEVLRVERVEQHGGLAVVRFRGVLLEHDEDRFIDARAVRLAVPVRLEPDPALAGSPWWLAPPPPATVERPHSEPIEDVDLLVAVRDALGRAGLAGVEVDEAQAPADGWVTADARGRWPSGASVDGTVWLRRDPAGLRLAGTSPDTAARSAPDDDGPDPSRATPMSRGAAEPS